MCPTLPLSQVLPKSELWPGEGTALPLFQSEVEALAEQLSEEEEEEEEEEEDDDEEEEEELELELLERLFRLAGAGS